MIPAPFDYKRASSAAEAISLVSEYGEDAKFLAGGHSLLPLMKLRLAQPAVLIDIARITDLSYIRDAGDHIAIGALTRHMDVEKSPIVLQHAPLLANAASHVGDPQVRHRGTIGGSIAHADSASDLPATTLALGATYVVHGPNGAREIPANEFYVGFLESALAPDEMLTEIRVPKMNGATWGFQKFNRRAQDWAIVGVAAWKRGNEAGVALVNMVQFQFLQQASLRRSQTEPALLMQQNLQQLKLNHSQTSTPAPSIEFISRRSLFAVHLNPPTPKTFP